MASSIITEKTDRMKKEANKSEQNVLHLCRSERVCSDSKKKAEEGDSEEEEAMKRTEKDKRG